MSSRKENAFNKTSASKVPRNRPLEQQRSKHGPLNLNTTFANLAPPSQKFKPDLTATFVHTPATDYDLQCDIAYSKYLQALAFQQYTSKQQQKHTLFLNDQLSKYTEILSQKQDTISEFQQKIEECEMKTAIQELVRDLEDNLERNLKLLPPPVIFGFTKILWKLKHASNHLYLNNVKVFNSQEEYDRLQMVLKKSGKILMQIINSSSDINKYQKLQECLTQFKSVEKEISTFDNSVKRLESDINELVLKTVSNKLFEVGVNKEDYDCAISIS